ncbi:MAG TPA: alanine racemase, partial [Solirubrobacteraceae bacterium]|nr:alanine racemase [Solirubrobacteraceae bacterium]
MSARAVAAVNLAAVERNCARLRAASPRLCAVVKADAYGHGAVPCSRALLRAGAEMLAVATADEALELRAAGIDARLLVLGPLTGDELERALAVGCEIVAWTDEILDAAARLGGAAVHVKLDTGMGRFGTREALLADRLADRAASTPGLALAGAMTHFATADEPDRDFFEQQLARFSSWVAPLRERHPGVLVHGENSAALLAAGRVRFDMARCGVALYGLDPFGEDPAARGLDPALELRSWVAAVKPCDAGESAGYGRRFVATGATELAMVPLGYGDGWRRAFSNNAEVLVEGVRRPLVGTVSMDSFAADLGPASGVPVGAEVVVIGARGGERVGAEELARRAGTINYEITCGLTARLPRSYHR